MDWFEQLTGFRETEYANTRARLSVEGDRLQSLVNGKSYSIGELELGVTANVARSGEVRRWFPRTNEGHCGDRRCAADASAAAICGALFQVASQFNLLEMVSPTVTPEQGVTRYGARPHPRSGVRDRCRRGDGLSQLLRSGGQRRLWPDGCASARWVGRSR